VLLVSLLVLKVNLYFFLSFFRHLLFILLAWT
jgi:hypothetical protein